jgi:hypothetical protein
MKYLVLICRGHVPDWNKKMNADLAEFLRYFLPKGSKITRETGNTVAHSLHLAFKDMRTEEVYDVLMAQFLQAVAKYDPKYTEKVKVIVDCIDYELSSNQQIRCIDIGRHVDFDSNRYLRLLCRRGFLVSVKGKHSTEDGREGRTLQTYFPSTAHRKASKSLAAALDNSNNLANSSSAF